VYVCKEAWPLHGCLRSGLHVPCGCRCHPSLSATKLRRQLHNSTCPRIHQGNARANEDGSKQQKQEETPPLRHSPPISSISSILSILSISSTSSTSSHTTPCTAISHTTILHTAIHIQPLTYISQLCLFIHCRRIPRLGFSGVRPPAIPSASYATKVTHRQACRHRIPLLHPGRIDLSSKVSWGTTAAELATTSPEERTENGPLPLPLVGRRKGKAGPGSARLHFT